LLGQTLGRVADELAGSQPAIPDATGQDCLLDQLKRSFEEPLRKLHPDHPKDRSRVLGYAADIAHSLKRRAEVHAVLGTDPVNNMLVDCALLGDIVLDARHGA